MPAKIAKIKDYYQKITSGMRRRANITNSALLVLLGIFILLDLNKYTFQRTGAINFGIFITAVITGLSIMIPLWLKRRSATKTFAILVAQELFRNLSELEYAEREFNKDYNQIPPGDGAASAADQQTMEMSKIMGAAARLDGALEDTAYTGIVNSRIVADISQSIAVPVIEAYSGIASARKTTRHFADFFSKLLDGEKGGMSPVFTTHARQHEVDPAITMVKEDVCVAIKQVYKAIDALNEELRKSGQKQKPVYRDEVVKQYGCDKKPTTS